LESFVAAMPAVVASTIPGFGVAESQQADIRNTVSEPMATVVFNLSWLTVGYYPQNAWARAKR
jgi:hypothetical protein